MREISTKQHCMVIWTSKWHQLGPIACMAATWLKFHLIAYVDATWHAAMEWNLQLRKVMDA